MEDEGQESQNVMEAVDSPKPRTSVYQEHKLHTYEWKPKEGEIKWVTILYRLISPSQLQAVCILRIIAKFTPNLTRNVTDIKSFVYKVPTCMWYYISVNLYYHLLHLRTLY